MAGLVPAIHELDYRLVEVLPCRVFSQNKADFPRSAPVLDVVLALDRRTNVVIDLEVLEAF
jgi:hypothetical protein